MTAPAMDTWLVQGLNKPYGKPAAFHHPLKYDDQGYGYTANMDYQPQTMRTDLRYTWRVHKFRPRDESGTISMCDSRNGHAADLDQAKADIQDAVDVLCYGEDAAFWGFVKRAVEGERQTT